MAALEQRKAVLQLLGDDDPVTVALVKEQLAGRGAAELQNLRELLSTADSARAAEALREIIKTIEARDSDGRLQRSGIYFYRLTSAGTTVTQRLTLLR